MDNKTGSHTCVTLKDLTLVFRSDDGEVLDSMTCPNCPLNKMHTYEGTIAQYLCAQDKPRCLKVILDKYEDWFFSQRCRFELIAVAASSGNAATAKVIIEKSRTLGPQQLENVLTHRPSKYTKNILSLANNVEVAKVLVENGTPINPSGNGMSPLATHVLQQNNEIVELLLCNGAPADEETKDGLRPLMLACDSSNEGIVRSLLNRGADINNRDFFGRTALHHLAKSPARATPQLIRLLAQDKHDLLAVSENGFTPVCHAYMNKKTSFIESILDYEFDSTDRFLHHKTLLHVALGVTEVHDTQQIKKLIEKDPSYINAQDIYGNTPLFAAVVHQPTSTKKSCVKALLDAGADPNISDNMSFSPAMFAVQIDEPDISELLIEYGTDVNIRDTNGATILSNASRRVHDTLICSLMRHNVHIGDYSTMENIAMAGPIASDALIVEMLKYGFPSRSPNGESVFSCLCDPLIQRTAATRCFQHYDLMCILLFSDYADGFKRSLPVDVWRNVYSYIL